ncbi:ubiquinol--cytochrome-c reductase subunit 6 [Entomophthora muscae]|uniref:Ubiquinol--cytochrome-c reductase subunit 6 n=1 Tax=Entomophthora muscae TaxID=34485 RepID=A0ACC2U182_9FUNG|nr:ubiquinol--cytochrome-c reductase subunit 6 [Entomophthora muscae]
MFCTAFDFLFPTVYADEVEVQPEEEEEEPEDLKPIIAEECGNTPKCAEAKHHLHDCEKRVSSGSEENCVEELFHFMHCVDECVAPKLFANLK